MKEAAQLVGVGIEAGDIDSLEGITIETRQTQILGDGRPMMVFRPDMIDAKGQRI